MDIKFSSIVLQELKIIKHKDKKLSDRIKKQLILFQLNPKHPSLRIHKLTGRKEIVWSISITISFRMIFILVDKNVAYFVDIGTHDEVYR